MPRPLKWLIPALGLLVLAGWYSAHRGAAEGRIEPPGQQPSAKVPGAALIPSKKLPVPESAPSPVPAAQIPGPSDNLETKLAALAPPGYEAAHPGRLARLLALLKTSPDDPELLAGALLLLSRGQPQEAGFWVRARAAFPDDPCVADVFLRDLLQGAADAPKALEGLDLPDPRIAMIRAALAAEAGDEGQALTLLEQAASGPWNDLSGRAEHGLARILDALGEPPGVFERFELLVRYPRPDLAWLGRAGGTEGGDPRSLEAVARLGARVEAGTRSLVGLVSAMHLQEQAWRAHPTPEAATKLAELEVRRKAFWDWDKAYRARSAEPLRPVFERLGLPFTEATALHGMEMLKSREAELLPDERRLLEQGIEAVYGEVDAYRADSRPR